MRARLVEIERLAAVEEDCKQAVPVGGDLARPGQRAAGNGCGDAQDDDGERDKQHHDDGYVEPVAEAPVNRSVDAVNEFENSYDKSRGQAGGGYCQGEDQSSHRNLPALQLSGAAVLK